MNLFCFYVYYSTISVRHKITQFKQTAIVETLAPSSVARIQEAAYSYLVALLVLSSKAGDLLFVTMPFSVCREFFHFRFRRAKIVTRRREQSRDQYSVYQRQ
jgi:hypothetical protein